MVKSPHILLTYGTGVVLWHSSGELLTLASDKQVTGFLEDGCRVMDDLTPEQVATLTGRVSAEAAAALFDGPELAHVLRRAQAGILAT